MNSHSPQADHFLEKSCLVVAHPDDEVLWFSSILEKVDRVLICFLANADQPERGAARLRVLEKYPLPTVETLGIDVPHPPVCCNWNNPIETEFGLQRTEDGRESYEYSFRSVKRELSLRLKDALNVYTHNPWGEYGHEAHVQVFRAVQVLADEKGFGVWFPGYVAERTHRLSCKYVPQKVVASFDLNTNKKLAHQIRDIYLNEGCWTARDDYCWPDRESFYRFRNIKTESGEPKEETLPLQFIK